MSQTARASRNTNWSSIETISSVGLDIERFENDWNFWLYPAQVNTNIPPGVLVTHNWSEAVTNLAAGGKVLFMPGNADLDPAKCPPMKNVPVFWNIQMTVRPPANPDGEIRRHARPALRNKFPGARGISHRSELRLAVDTNHQRRPLGESHRAPRELKPIVWAIDDWNRNWKLGVIFESNVGAGKLLVSAINLDNQRGGSELQQLRRSLLDYMAGEKFKPMATLTSAQAGSLWTRNGAPAGNEPARVFDPDLNDGTIPAAAPPKP